MGSCVDISRMMNLAAELAKDAGLQIHQLPVVGCAPELDVRKSRIDR